MLLFLNCSKNNKDHLAPEIQTFNGLYNVEYENIKIDHIWVFTENIWYIFYPGDKSVNYETPTHYYIDNNKFYSCGIDNIFTPTKLSDCKKKNKDPKYKLISTDTIQDGNFKIHVVKLEDYYSKSTIKISSIIRE